MRLVMLGPPGSGKGTQSERLAEQLKLVHLSTGEMLRQSIARGEPVGLEAKNLLTRPTRPQRRDDQPRGPAARPRRFAAGCLLDGFPRTIDQAQARSTPIWRSRERRSMVC